MSTYREVYKYGDKREEAADDNLKSFLERKFNVNKDSLKPTYLLNKEPVKLPSIKLEAKHIESIEAIVGKENVKTRDFDRAMHAYGKYYMDILKLRLGEVMSPPDIVVSPSTHEQVEAIVSYCNTHEIAIIPFGGGTSVTRALEAPKGGISLNMATNLNKVIKLNSANQTVTVQAGMLGPELEKQLNKSGYTCAHFPQSFEFATVGGWVAARGAGQCSTGYGRIEQLMVAMKVVCPAGTFSTLDYPAAAQGLNFNEIIAGSEGTLGVITEVSLKVYKHRPDDWKMGSIIFKDFESAVKAMQEMIQAEAGKPHIFRISDGKETDYGFSLKGFDKSIQNTALNFMGFKAPTRSLLYYTIQGDPYFNKFYQKKINKIARKNGGMPIGTTPVKKWLDMRYHSSYLRDTYMDVGMFIDTIETSVTWENLIPLWKALHTYFDKFPQYFGFSHISHVYENGANLYIIYQGKMDKGNEVKQFEDFHKGVIETINNNKGALSHHHGVGRLLAPLMETQYGKTGMQLFKGIKSVFDPNGIMNPGGTLGLD